MFHKKLISKLNLSGTDVFFLLLFAVCGLFSVWSYFCLDQRVFTLASNLPENWGNNLLTQMIVCLGKVWLPIWLLLVWFIAAKKQQPVLISLLALIMVLLIVTALKHSIHRPRPRDVVNAAQTADKQHRIYKSSFPSGDTASIFTVATVAAFFVSWRWTTLFLTASVAVGVMRVTQMAHYPSDIFAGAGIGIFAGWLAIQIDRHHWRQLKLPHLNLTRSIAIPAAIIIPLVVGISGGLDKLFFFAAYGLLVVLVFLASKIIDCCKPNES
ncbi:MAG: phosphatase PAP2 family protein [Phycisphaerae bacterium]|jgi:undecaprenyl-diphosphatase|nr:hypothetical protein [Phycisphaerales bacterium]HBR20929.1 hypothetical protein [Phycisphaerales bacterium]